MTFPGRGPLRVGLLFEYSSLNGGERSMLCALDQISSRDVTVVPFCPATGPLAQEFAHRQMPCVSWPDSRTPAAVLTDPSGGAWLAHQAHELNLDLLHANSLTMSRRLGWLATNLPCATTGHIRDIMRLSTNAVTHLGRHRQLAAVSEAARLASIKQGLAAEQVTTLHNGVDLQRFFPAPATGWLHRELGLPQETPLVATIGQICLRKGQDLLAAAAERLDAARQWVNHGTGEGATPAHFLIIGERYSVKPESVQFEAEITQAFARAGMSHRLHLLGTRDDIPHLLREVSLLLHPARQEPLGRVLLEAAACGIPILATSVGGTEEILTHGQSAWLVPPQDADALADALAKLLSDSHLRAQLGQAAARIVSQRFSAATAAAGLQEFWQHAAAGTHTR